MLRSWRSLVLSLLLAVLATPSLAMNGIGHGPGGIGTGSGTLPNGGSSQDPYGIGQIYASVQTALGDESRILRDALLGRASGPSDGVGVWALGHGAWGRHGAETGTPLTSRDSGGLLGVDAPIVGGWRAGLAGGAMSSDLSAPDDDSHADITTWQVGGYVAGPLGPLRLVGGGGYEDHRLQVQRSDGNGSFYDARFGATTDQAFGEASYPLAGRTMNWAAFLRGIWTQVRIDRFAEAGAYGVGGAASTSSTAASELGFRWRRPDANFSPWLSFAWRREWGSLTPAADLFFSGVPIEVYGTPRTRDAAVVQGGLDLKLWRGVRLAVIYDGLFGDGVQENRAAVRLADRF